MNSNVFGRTRIHKIVGNLQGLKAAQLKQLDHLFRRRVGPDEIASWELLKQTAKISREIRRRVGVLVHRKGTVEAVVVGENRSLAYPKLPSASESFARLSGYRLIRTELHGEGLGRMDLTELSQKRLDLVATIGSDEDGRPQEIEVGYLAPTNGDGTSSPATLKADSFQDLELPFIEFIGDVELRLAKAQPKLRPIERESQTILCAIRTSDVSPVVLNDSLGETKDLCRSAGLEVVETIIQYRDRPDPKYLFGEGKFSDVLLRASELGARLLLFQQNLSSNQMRHLNDATPLKVIDRTQLILDIFAQRAKSHEGKLQVELAQLRYNQPRLREFDTGLSRLVGGIGGRGPGETKLEIHSRRARDRIHRLEKDIRHIAEKRATRRTLRKRKNVPVVSIVGYTNAGKSTLLNSLTNANAFTENRPFATLDPFSKKIRFPEEREVILTDTVGFLRDLPKDLLFAFRSTLEEIGETDLIVHVIDSSKADSMDRMEVVNDLLQDLGFADIPQVLVLNKADVIGFPEAERLAHVYRGVAISALQPETCHQLLQRIESHLWPMRRVASVAP